MNAISADQIKAAYDRDYKDGKFGGPDYTHKWILRLLRPDRQKRLLDIGCGQGYLLAEAGRLGLLTCGIDISQEAAGIAKENSPSSEIICDDAHRLIWKDGYFDYVTNIGSLEHFRDPEACLKEIKRAIKPDGKVCIMLPNLYYYRHIINKLLWKKDPTSYQTIERFASLRGWAKMIRKNGFKIEKVYKYNKLNRNRLMVFIRSIIIPLYLSHHFVFICRKDER
ncbi:class I SAM-dependent methyltransferase [Omnitrophica bacterium]|nr:class I SAM-dependent methyltransferase [Candidatus Omnitrophota bacterium]